MTQKFIQCRMKRGDEITVAWIEDRGAKVGLCVELIGTGDGLWEVVEAYTGTVFTKDEMRENESKHRKGFESIR